MKLGKAPPTDKSATDAANKKLISALGAEERRLRDNEFRYAEKIKLLSTQLETEKANGKRVLELLKQLESTKGAYEKVKKDLETTASIKSQQDAKLMEFNIKLSEATHEITNLRDILKRLEKDSTDLNHMSEESKKMKEELELNRRLLIQLEKDFQISKELYQEAEAEKTRLGVRIIKEREQSKIKFAEIRKEKDMALETTLQIQKQVEFLKSNFNTKEEGFRSQIEKVINSHRYEIDSEVKKATELLQKHHEMQTRPIQHALDQSREAYHSLETEFRSAIQRERMKLNDAKQQVSDKNQIISALSEQERGHIGTINDLIKLGKDLKGKVERLTANEQHLETSHKVLCSSYVRSIERLLIKK